VHKETRMRKIAAVYAVIFIVLFSCNFFEKAFCTTPKDKPDCAIQREDRRQADSEGQSQQPDPDNRPEVPAAPSVSLFEKITIVMSMRQVTDLIGSPCDTKQYMAGKNFIPFYTGTDTVRLEVIYNGCSSKEKMRI
jgi:hypothetical protein